MKKMQIVGIVLIMVLFSFIWFVTTRPVESTDEIVDVEEIRSFAIEEETPVVIEEIVAVSKTDDEVREIVRETEQMVWDDIHLTEEEQTVLWSTCKALNVNYWLILALIESESNFNPDAVGDSGNSVGYMQINKCNWKHLQEWYGLDVNDPIQNLLGGTWLVKELMDKYGTLTQVIMSYKCGESRAKELLEQGVVLDCVEQITNRAIELELLHE